MRWHLVLGFFDARPVQLLPACDVSITCANTLLISSSQTTKSMFLYKWLFDKRSLLE